MLEENTAHQLSSEDIQGAKNVFNFSALLNSQLTQEMIESAHETGYVRAPEGSIYPLTHDKVKHNKELDRARDILLRVVAEPFNYPDPPGVVGKAVDAATALVARGYQHATGQETYVPGALTMVAARATAQVAQAAGAVVVDKAVATAQTAGTAAGQVARATGTVAKQAAQTSAAALGRAGKVGAEAIASEYKEQTGEDYFLGAITLAGIKKASSAACSAARAGRNVLFRATSAALNPQAIKGSDTLESARNTKERDENELTTPSSGM